MNFHRVGVKRRGGKHLECPKAHKLKNQLQSAAPHLEVTLYEGSVGRGVVGKEKEAKPEVP